MELLEETSARVPMPVDEAIMNGICYDPIYRKSSKRKGKALRVGDTRSRRLEQRAIEVACHLSSRIAERWYFNGRLSRRFFGP